MTGKARSTPAADPAWELTRRHADAAGLLPITVMTRCGTVGTPAEERHPHPVTMQPDGSIDTGHDIASERVADALGGRVTCLDLVDHTAAAVRGWLTAQLRLVPPPVSSKDGRRWTMTQKARCCARSYSLVSSAIRHFRSSDHAAASHQAPVEQVTDFAAAFRNRLAAATEAVSASVLWQHGLSAPYCRDLEQRLEVDQPIPLEVHLAILARQPDLTWLRPVIAAHLESEPKLAARIVWEADEWQAIPERQRVDWLLQPIPPNLSLTLATAGKPVEQVRYLARSQSASMSWAASVIASWLTLGIDLTPADWQVLSATEQGVRSAPSRHQIDRARLLLDGKQICTDKDLAMALVRHGNASAAATAIRRERAAGA